MAEVVNSIPGTFNPVPQASLCDEIKRDPRLSTILAGQPNALHLERLHNQEQTKAIALIQQVLNANGAEPKLGLTGRRDQATLQAAIAFQSKQNLEADGVFGKDSLRAAMAILQTPPPRAVELPKELISDTNGLKQSASATRPPSSILEQLEESPETVVATKTPTHHTSQELATYIRSDTRLAKILLGDPTQSIRLTNRGTGQVEPSIELLQKLLIALNPEDKLQPTGIRDSATLQAVKIAQKSYGLEEDGVVGRKTLSALLKTVENYSFWTDAFLHGEAPTLPSISIDTPKPPVSTKPASTKAVASTEATFEFAIAHLFEVEGGLNTDSKDLGNKNGGVTNYGVTDSTYRAFRANHGLPKQSVALITKNEAKQLYKEMYWDTKIGGSTERLDFLHFDAAVNHGPGNARLLMSRALDYAELKAGKDLTMTNLSKVEEGLVIEGFGVVRKQFYESIVARRPEQNRFIKGWLNRNEKTIHIAQTARFPGD